MGTQSNGNPYCGRMATVYYNNREVQVELVDKCMGCVSSFRVSFLSSQLALLLTSPFRLNTITATKPGTDYDIFPARTIRRPIMRSLQGPRPSVRRAVPRCEMEIRHCGEDLLKVSLPRTFFHSHKTAITKSMEEFAIRLYLSFPFPSFPFLICTKNEAV